MELLVHNGAGERLDTALHPGAPGSDAIVVIGHGVTANRDRPFALALAEALADAGLASLRFSFSGNGSSGGRFADSTVTKEVGDLGSVLDALGPRPVAYVGHSQGAAVGVLRAARDPRITALVSLAGMVHVAEFARAKFGHLEPDRDVMWDEPACPLSSAYVDDMQAIGSTIDSCAEVSVPWLLVHGTADTVVPPGDSRDAHARAPHSELVWIPGADHVFSGDAMTEMTAATVPWLVGRLH